MPAPVIRERWDSREGSLSTTESGGTQDWVYVVAYATTPDQAVGLVGAEAPLNLTNPDGQLLIRKGFDWEIAEGDLWHVTVKYDVFEPQQNENDFSFNFDTTGGQEHITQGIRNVSNYAHPAILSTGAEPTNHHGTIGVTKDGIEGTDIPTRAFRWTETHTVPLALIQFTNYSQVLELLTGTKNQLPFRGRPARACIFHGAQGGKKTSQLGEVTYHFEAGRHVTNLEVGGIVGIAKEAWDYLWFEYDERQDSASRKLVRMAMNAHVDEVIYEANWSQLGIGS